jgi:glutamate-1-semialdehyde 2,1-aminomutase
MKTEGFDLKNQQPTSADLFQQACQVLPGGISRNTIFRKPHPYYAKSASGCYITDIEGIQRVDFANNMASLIHGHSFPAMVDAITQQLQQGTAFTMATEAEVRFAKLLCDRNQGFEKIRFVNSGTEAVMAMIKAARAFTGRPKIAKVEGAYHGSYDFAEVSQTSTPQNWGDSKHPNSVPVAVGTPQNVLDDVVVIPFNDSEIATQILDQFTDQIACVLIDPMPHRVGLVPATNEFINGIYQWTQKNGALLAFDEVITFRTRYSGAQEKYDVKPDLTALGKIIGGGFPAGALAGSDEVMKVLDPREAKVLLPHSGTFSANPITMTAGRIAMELFDQTAVEKINQLASKARKQITEAIKLADIRACVTGGGSIFRLHLKPEPPINYRKAWINPETTQLVKTLLDHLFQEGIIMINTCSAALSSVMTGTEIDRLSEAMLNGFKKIKPELDRIQKLNNRDLL